ncbi:MAG: hypothetical protein QOG63_858 [Thermoleophilaceae bacterium]|jgi:hypothetical protein|nr:hypothetical protein [Thermoleophilaceae bacterium]
MFRPSLATVVVLVAIASLGFMAVALLQRARTQGQGATQRAQPQATPPAPIEPLNPPSPLDRSAPAPQPDTSPRPTRGKSTSYRILRIRAGRTVQLHSKPGGGSTLASAAATTEFGSHTTLAVAKRRGPWFGVTSTLLPNGRLGWVRTGNGNFRGSRTPLAIRVDLSQRRLRLTKGKRTVRSVTVAVGRPGATTPTGRFAITDKLAGARYGSYYGCCILALSGKQPHLPAGWTGGDRLAIHGTDAPGSVGLASSAGCLRARDEDLHALMRRVSLGTPVFIHA